MMSRLCLNFFVVVQVLTLFFSNHVQTQQQLVDSRQNEPGRLQRKYPPPDKQHRQDIQLLKPRALSAKTKAELVNTQTAGLLGQVSEANLKEYVKTLSAFHTRNTRSQTIHRVGDWLVERFRSFGYNSVKLNSYSEGGLQLNNVVCTKPSTEPSGKVIIVGAHYDCRAEDLEDASVRAPGADDNATGVALLLEVARVLSMFKVKDELRFVAFSGEEQGLWGSEAYAQLVKDKNLDLRFFLNLDMVGFPATDGSIIVERDMGNDIATNDKPSRELVDIIVQMAQAYTKLPTLLGPIYSSDYIPFESRGYVVVGLFESGKYPAYHATDDTAERVNYIYLTQVAHLVTATLSRKWQ
jgi:hypothetical protein